MILIELQVILDQTCLHTACICVRDVSADQPGAAYRAPARRRLGDLANPEEQLFSAVEESRGPTFAKEICSCFLDSQYGTSC